jgi:hypothetical protein
LLRFVRNDNFLSLFLGATKLIDSRAKGLDQSFIVAH